VFRAKASAFRAGRASRVTIRVSTMFKVRFWGFWFGDFLIILRQVYAKTDTARGQGQDRGQGCSKPRPRPRSEIIVLEVNGSSRGPHPWSWPDPRPEFIPCRRHAGPHVDASCCFGSVLILLLHLRSAPCPSYPSEYCLARFSEVFPAFCSCC